MRSAPAPGDSPGQTLQGRSPLSRLAEEQRQQVVDERPLAAPGRAVDQEGALQPATGRGALGDGARGRLPEAEEALPWRSFRSPPEYRQARPVSPR